MHAVALCEVQGHERRVAITPDIAKKLIDNGHTVTVETGAGLAAGFSDGDYEAAGAKISHERKVALAAADCVFRVTPLSKDELKVLGKDTAVIGLVSNAKDKTLHKKYHETGALFFSLERLPRITRAQPMDVLSSQNNLTGYRAVIEAVHMFGRAMPMMTTAAGNIAPAKVLILGVGVAGLQAIATARRLGAIVSAYDVRSAAAEQVKSLGARFLQVNFVESGDGEGGYAKEMSRDYQLAQEKMLQEEVKTQDIVICCAQIPGRTAPILLSAEMAAGMRPGSVIADTAVETGGNCALSQRGAVIEHDGIKIIGLENLPAAVPYDASRLYSRNLYNFFMHYLQNKDNLQEDELLAKTLLVKEA